MHLRYRSFTQLAALCLTLAAGPALAAKPAPHPEAIPPGTVVHRDAQIAAGACQLGQIPTASGSFIQFIFPPNDQYYTLLNPAACECSPALVHVTMAHAYLYWPSPCQLQVNVSVVGAILDPTTQCLVPDQGNILCGPVSYVISGPAAGGIGQHDFALPPGCCIDGPAFLKIEFPSNGSCTKDPLYGLTSPQLVVDDFCDPCVSYNWYAGDPNYRDLCTYWGFPGNPIMWVDADCCPVTPTLPSTWGRIKTLYR